MKTSFFSLLCIALMLPQFTFGQQKIYYDAEGEQIDSAGAFDHYFEISRQPNGWMYVKSFDENKLLQSEGLFSLYLQNEKVEEGLHKTYRRETGGLWFTQEYNSGKLLEIKSFYGSRGELKRIEHYKNGKFKRGECFNEDGSKRKFTPLFIPPEFPGGVGHMMKFLRNNVEYPARAQQNNIEGVIKVSFVVEKDGSLTKVKLLNRLGSGCDAEALKVVNAMPHWTPGFIDDEPAKVGYTLPIRFRLD